MHERSAPSVGDHEAVMSVTELLRAKSSSTGGGADRRSLQRALLAGAGAAAASACAVVLPALLVWVASPQSTVDWTTALGVGASLWLLGTGAHLTVGAAHVTVVPLAFLALAVCGAAWGAVRAAAAGGSADAPVLRGRPGAPAGGPRPGRLDRRVCRLRLPVVDGRPGGRARARPSSACVMPVVVVPALAAGLALGWLVRRRRDLLGPGAAPARLAPRRRAAGGAPGAGGCRRAADRGHGGRGAHGRAQVRPRVPPAVHAGAGAARRPRPAPRPGTRPAEPRSLGGVVRLGHRVQRGRRAPRPPGPAAGPRCCRWSRCWAPCPTRARSPATCLSWCCCR